MEVATKPKPDIGEPGDKAYESLWAVTVIQPCTAVLYVDILDDLEWRQIKAFMDMKILFHCQYTSLNDTETSRKGGRRNSP